MIFSNSKVKSLLFALVVFSLVASLSCVSASDDLNATDVIGDNIDMEDVTRLGGQIYISPNGTGDGLSQDSPTNWYNAYYGAASGDTIIFGDGNYTWNTMETVSKSLILKGSGNSTIDGGNMAGFLRITAETTLQLINLTFYNGETGDTGTGAIVNSGVLYVNDCYFSQNTGWGTEGGAIHNLGQCDVYNSTFFSNTAKKGGSFYSEKNSILNVYNCLFIKGSSKEGNCFNVKEATANIYNCNFVNCSAKSGIIHTKKGTVNVYNSNFTNSRAVDYAACVDVDKESYVLIENCSFNRCTSVGGVIWNTDGEKIGTGDGGAVYVEKGGSLTIRNSAFTACSAKANGGALYIESKGDAIVNNCSFISNTAAQGRHIYIEGSYPSITDCLFEVNSTISVSDVPSGNDASASISVDVGTNFMSYNIPVNVNASEVGLITKSSDVLSIKGLSDGEYTINLESKDKSNTNTYIFTQESAIFKVGNSTAQVNDTTPTNGTAPTNDTTPTNDTNDTNITPTYVLTAPNVELYYRNGTRFYAYLTDSENNPVADKEVIINLNGVDNKRTTNENGSASISINLNSGVYDVKIMAENLTVNSKVTVLPTVSGKDITKVFRNGTQYYADFTDGSGNPLAGQMVEFNINGVFYNRTTNENGTAKLNINLAQGDYIITARNLLTDERASNNITVLSKITKNNDVVKYYKNDTQYTVQLIGSDGNPVGSGETVIFNINGVFYARTTNESGFAKLNINLDAGDYVITAEYGQCKVSNSITVLPILKAGDLTKTYGTSDQFVATLVDGQGNPLADAVVTFNINGVFYQRTTDSEGNAKLNINLMAGEYIITSSYNGFNIANKVTINS